MCASALLVSGKWFPWRYPSSQALTKLFIPSFTKTPETFWEGMWYECPILGWALCTLTSCWGGGPSGLMNINCEEKFLWWGLKDAVVYRYSNKSFLLPCSFWRLIVLIFFPSACGLCSHRFLTPMVVSGIDSISWSRSLMQTESVWLLWWLERKCPP